MQKVLQNCRLYGEVTSLFSHITLLEIYKQETQIYKKKKSYQKFNRVSY